MRDAILGHVASWGDRKTPMAVLRRNRRPLSMCRCRRDRGTSPRPLFNRGNAYSLAGAQGVPRGLDMHTFAAARASFLLAVLWFDLMFDVQTRQHTSDTLPPHVRAS